MACASGGEKYSSWVDNFQTSLDVIGIADPTEIADGINALIYAGRGQWGNASISAMGIIPYIGDVGKAGRLGSKVVVSVSKRMGKNGKAVEAILENGGKIDINAARVKEWIPNLNAPIGTLQKVKFEDFIPGSKGYKRTPTQEELDFLNSLF